MRRLLTVIAGLIVLGVALVWARSTFLSASIAQTQQSATPGTFLPIIVHPSLPTAIATEAASTPTGTAPTATPSGTSTPTRGPLELPVIALAKPISGFTNPVYITHAGDSSGRLFVVEKPGRIRIVKNGALTSTPFLDIVSKVDSSGSEQGLLSVAFAPNYASSGRFYVYYINSSGNIVVARYKVSANADLADSSSGQIVLSIAHPVNTNHNGGQLAFGPDGYLYLGTGDGGAGGDPNNHAQDTGQLLGKLLRIDVETGNPATYNIPTTNPFKNASGAQRCDPLPTSGAACQEIWAFGLRNPWRFSFDPQTGDLYIGDVGQNAYEEVDYQPASSTGGENYGWRCNEGLHDYDTSENCTGKTFVPPVTEYGHTSGNCSITGGAIYRATQYSRMQGIYFYGDYCTGQIWGLHRNGATWQSDALLDGGFNISTFGTDQAGNLYVANYGSGTISMVTDTGS